MHSRATKTTIVAICGLLDLSGCCFLGIGCKNQQPTAQTLAQAIKNCATTDMIASGSIIYTGPTGAGPASFWVQTSFTPPQYTIGAMPTDIFGTPLPANLLAPLPTVGTCAFDSSKDLDLKANVGATVTSLPLSASAQAELKNASVTSVTAQGLRWEEVLFQNYNIDVRVAPHVSEHVGPDVWVAIGMLKIQNYVAKLNVSSVSNVNFGAKYNGPLTAAATGNLSTGVTASYDNNGTLTLTIPGETYIAGIFGKADPTTGQLKTASQGGRSNAVRITPIAISGDRK